MRPTIPKHTPADHDALKASAQRWRMETTFVGFLCDDVEQLELRNCPCGSTLAVVLGSEGGR